MHQLRQVVRRVPKEDIDMVWANYNLLWEERFRSRVIIEEKCDIRNDLILSLSSWSARTVVSMETSASVEILGRIPSRISTLSPSVGSDKTQDEWLFGWNQHHPILKTTKKKKKKKSPCLVCGPASAAITPLLLFWEVPNCHVVTTIYVRFQRRAKSQHLSLRWSWRGGCICNIFAAHQSAAHFFHCPHIRNVSPVDPEGWWRHLVHRREWTDSSDLFLVTCSVWSSNVMVPVGRGRTRTIGNSFRIFLWQISTCEWRFLVILTIMSHGSK